nr:histidine phosphatase family protein [Kineosporia mesophila]
MVRHASTAVTGRVPSGGDEVGPQLSPSGLSEARALSLPSTGVLLSSPMLRARQTAEALGLPSRVAPDWAELRLGDWNGLSYREIAARWPQEYAQWRESAAARPPGGESVLDLQSRIADAVARLRSEHAGRSVVVVTHTGPIRAAVASALDAGPAAFWRLRIDPASVTTLRYWADGGVEVAAVNAAATPFPSP